MDPLTAFVFGLVSVVPKIVLTWVETRSRLRVEQLRADLAERHEQRGFERSLRLKQAERPTVPQQRSQTDARPAIVVAAVPTQADPSLAGVPDTVRRLLGEIDGIGARADVVPVERTAGGPVRSLAGARAAAERFAPQPAVVVYLTVNGATTTALAHLSTGFAAAGKAPAQAALIARYSWDDNGRGPAHRHINLAAVPERSAEDVVAYTVTWFLLALVDSYWQVKFGVDPGLLAQTRGESAAERTARLEREAAVLAAAGYTVTAEEIADDYIGLHVEGPSGDVVFVVDADYPDTPPVTIIAGGSRIELGAADWTPECTLADIVEALL
ncbi:hypothetical protein [Dactylosporangium sp. NPDC051541]|uniref:hypothetical protein n=1 Tax=Dactylosporangium sp. NPDC051541 TaxID=3363977 RepID=UPI00378C6C94